MINEGEVMLMAGVRRIALVVCTIASNSNTERVTMFGRVTLRLVHRVAQCFA